LGKQIHLVRH